MNLFYKKLFKLPDWFKPEVNVIAYWVHLLILAVVVLGLLQLFVGGDMFTIKNILFSIPLLAIGDILAHSLTGLS